MTSPSPPRRSKEEAYQGNAREGAVYVPPYPRTVLETQKQSFQELGSNLTASTWAGGHFLITTPFSSVDSNKQMCV